MKISKKRVEISLFSVGLIPLSIFLGLTSFSNAATFLPPTSLPPDGNIAVPINIGNTTQIKDGGLVVGGTYSADSRTPSFYVKGGTVFFGGSLPAVGTPREKLEVDGKVMATDFCTRNDKCLSTGGGSAISGGVPGLLTKWLTDSTISSSINLFSTTTGVGVGTSTPYGLLHIDDSASLPISQSLLKVTGVKNDSGLYILTKDYPFNIDVYDSYTNTGIRPGVTVDDEGRLGIGTANPNNTLDARGGISSDDISIDSTLRLSSSINPLRLSDTQNIWLGLFTPTSHNGFYTPRLFVGGNNFSTSTLFQGKVEFASDVSFDKGVTLRGEYRTNWTGNPQTGITDIQTIPGGGLVVEHEANPPVYRINLDYTKVAAAHNYACIGENSVLTSVMSDGTFTCSTSQPLTCIPASQSVALNSPVSFSANGGSGAYSWRATGGTIATGVGKEFSTQYSSEGAKTVVITSGDQTANCTANVSASLLSCSPARQTAGVNTDVNFLAYGGTGSYSWLTDGTPDAGSGANFTTKYGTAGTKTIAVTSGTQTVNCMADIGVSTLSCSSDSPTVPINSDASFSASGGSGSYSWTGGGAPATGSGANFITQYSAPGTNNVIVTSGAQSANCSVVSVPILACTPTTQSADYGSFPVVSATGGTGVYSWSVKNSQNNIIETRLPSGASSLALITSNYDTLGANSIIGNNVVTVTSGTQVKNCSLGVRINPWTELASAPDYFHYGSSLVYNGGNYIYATRGGATSGFYRYSISSGSWTTMASTPVGIYAGGNLVYANGYIYLTQGGSSATFYRYSVSSNNWLTMTVLPGGVGEGGSLVYAGGDYIYATHGGSFDGDGRSYAFYRYSISGNNWSTMAVVPGSIYYGGSLVYAGGDYIYALKGGNPSAVFYRYSISGDSWSAMRSMPATASLGSALAYSSGDYIYALRGNSTFEFYRYSISGNSWKRLADAMGHSSTDYPSYEADLVYGGNNLLYMIPSYYKSNFYRYSITDDALAVNSAGSQGAGLASGADIINKSFARLHLRLEI